MQPVTLSQTQNTDLFNKGVFIQQVQPTNSSFPYSIVHFLFHSF